MESLNLQSIIIYYQIQDIYQNSTSLQYIDQAMIENKPEYKLKYQYCLKNESHQGQTLNYICLNQECTSNPLICSICKHQKHKNHKTEPLKYFIQRLHSKYCQKDRNYDKQLIDVEAEKSICLESFKEVINKITEEVRKVQEHIIHFYESARQNILESKSFRSKFFQFYQGLFQKSSQISGEYQFLIQNYLRRQENIGRAFIDRENFTALSNAFQKSAEKIMKQKNIVNVQTQKQIENWPKIEQIDTINNILAISQLPQNIKVNGKLFKQTNPSLQSPSMVIIPIDFRKLLNNKKLKLKITHLSKNSFLHMGFIQQSYAKTLHYKFPINLNSAQFKQKLCYLNNQGLVFGHKKNDIKTFSNNSTAVLTAKNKQGLDINIKQKHAQFCPVDKNKQFFCYFSILGTIQIQMDFL